MKFTPALLQMLKDAIKVGDDRLHDHIVTQIAAVRDALLQADRLERERVDVIRDMAVERVASQNQALERLATVHDRRFANLEKNASLHITSDEYDRRHQALEDRLTKLEVWRANLAGRYVAYGVIGAILIATVAGIITHLATG